MDDRPKYRGIRHCGEFRLLDTKGNIKLAHWGHSGPECDWASREILADYGREVAGATTEQSRQVAIHLASHFRRRVLSFLPQGRDWEMDIVVIEEFLDLVAQEQRDIRVGWSRWRRNLHRRGLVQSGDTKPLLAI